MDAISVGGGATHRIEYIVANITDAKQISTGY